MVRRSAYVGIWHLADMPVASVDVCLWHKADNKFSARNVRFWGMRDAGNHAVNCHSARIGLRTGAVLSATSGNPMILVVDIRSVRCSTAEDLVHGSGS